MNYIFWTQSIRDCWGQLSFAPVSTLRTGLVLVDSILAALLWAPEEAAEMQEAVQEEGLPGGFCQFFPLWRDPQITGPALDTASKWRQVFLHTGSEIRSFLNDPIKPAAF